MSYLLLVILTEKFNYLAFSQIEMLGFLCVCAEAYSEPGQASGLFAEIVKDLSAGWISSQIAPS